MNSYVVHTHSRVSFLVLLNDNNQILSFQISSSFRIETRKFLSYVRRYNVDIKHQAPSLVVEHMTVSGAIVCLISVRHMLEVLPIIVQPNIVPYNRVTNKLVIQSCT